MNYDKLSRSLRYYYEKGIMQKVGGCGPRDGGLRGAGEHFPASLWEQVMNLSEGMRSSGQDFLLPKKCHTVTRKA